MGLASSKDVDKKIASERDVLFHGGTRCLRITGLQCLRDDVVIVHAGRVIS